MDVQKAQANKSPFKGEFVENLKEFQCVRCEKKLFEHYIANCGHKFCKNCQKLVGDGSKRWKCNHCGKFVITVNKQDVEFETRFYNQEVYCSNKNYGCGYKGKLKNIMSHIEKCDKTREAALPVEIKTSPEIENIWDEIIKIKQEYKNVICSNCSKVENKFENFKDEVKKSMDGLNEKVNALTLHFETFNPVEANQSIDDLKQKLNDFTLNLNALKDVKKKIEKIEIDLTTQQHIINLQAEANKFQLEKLNQSFDEFKNAKNASDHTLKSFKELEIKIKDQADLNKVEITDIKEQLEQQRLETTSISQRLNDNEIKTKNLKDSTEIIQNKLSRVDDLKNALDTNMIQIKSNIEDLRDKVLPKIINSLELANIPIEESIVSNKSSMKEYNIILLGETGTGKSSLINSFANYSQFQDLTEAISSGKPITLIPSKFNLTDKYEVDHKIEAGENDGNERTELGKSFTINCKSYKFQFQDVIVRLIDTPGVGDTEGEKKDGKHVENILSFINNFDNLHAIGIVLKNSETKMTDRITYCLTTLLTNLNKTAMENIVFILTFSQGNNFQPGPVKDVIKLFIENKLKESNLVLNKNIMYCVDSRSFEYLIAAHQGIEFKPLISTNQNLNWKSSSEELARLISHINKLTPHKVKDIASLNDARNFINVISPFLSTVLENIESNKNFLNEYRTKYQDEDEIIKNAKNNIELRQIDIKILKLDQAFTFCKSKKCSKEISIGGEITVHYPQICCEGCHVPNGFRFFCAKMAFLGSCKECGCKIGDHERQFHKTEKVPSDLLTPEAKSKIDNAISAKEKWDIRVKEIEEREKQLELEKTTIEDAMKKFAKFLLMNSLSEPPETKSNETGNAYSMENEVLYQYDLANIKTITADEIYQLKFNLITLPLNGKKIYDILNTNASGLKSSLENIEKVNRFKKKCFELLQ